MKNLNKRFNSIIIKCQELRELHGFYYEEKCKDLLIKYSNEIKNKGLIDKCEDKTFAMQLCIMNNIEY